MIIKRHYNNIKKQEAGIFSKMNHIWISNPENNSVLGLENATVLPNIPYDSHDQGFNLEDPSFEKLSIACVAAYKHQPNVEGVQWFIDNVWTGVNKYFSGAEFLIYGSNLSRTTAEKWKSVKGVKVIGFVENVRDAYREATITVCPVQRGAGTNIKVLESGAHRRCCVLTESASRGLSNDNEIMECVTVALDPRKMIEQIISLLVNKQDTIEKSKKFQEVILRKYSSQKFNTVISNTVKNISQT